MRLFIKRNHLFRNNTKMYIWTYNGWHAVEIDLSDEPDMQDTAGEAGTNS